MNDAPLRAIPSVDKVLRDLGETDLPRPAIVAAVRRELAALRDEAMRGASMAPTADPLTRVRAALDSLRLTRLRPVINGTGIIVHTNFGRSPLADAAVTALADAAANYTNLEYDLTGGGRGGRAAYVEHNLAVLCGAEAAAVVNNCAAALVLVLRHFAAAPPRTEVVVSRGELVQIGGGFRVPDILEASGATLREIGTTNRTSTEDYAAAVGPQTAMVLRVHRSNFYMGGFIESPTREQIAAVARNAGVPYVETSAAARSFRPNRWGAASTSRRRPRRWRAAGPTSSASAATSCSGARRPASSPGGRSTSRL